MSEFAAVDEARLERTPYREEGRVDAATERARARDAAWQATAGVAGSARAVGPLVALASRGAPPWALRRALGGGGESPISKRPSLHRDAERFEALRDRADALGTGERRPAVMLAKLGPPAEHKARETFARGFFAAGGIRCTGAPGRSDAAAASAHAEAFRESGAHLACLCGSDPRYALEASDVARALTKAGATRVLLAGRPGEHEQAWRVAGITGFIHLGIDVTETLSELLDVEAEVRGREARDP